MYRICTRRQMGDADRRSTEEFFIPGIILMENAAYACVNALTKRFGSVSGEKVFCFCGKGNNGGDGLAVARLLSVRGAEVTVYLTHGDSYGGDALENRKMLSGMNVVVTENFDFLDLKLASADIIIDAIFGTGLRGEVDEQAYDVIDSINSSGKYVLSVDIPSGVSADTGEVCGICIDASETVTFAAYKQGMFLFPGCAYTGDISVADICTPKALLKDVNRFCTDDEFVSGFFPKRDKNTQKGDYGKVLIIGGSRGMTGAPVMAAQAALKAGAGLVTVASAKSLNVVLSSKLTEAMTYPLTDDDGSLSAECIDELLPLLDRADSVLIGPGMGKGRGCRKVFEAVMKNCRVPLVVDADGLNLLSEDPSVMESCSCSLIFTPHEVEMSRLLGEELSVVTEGRISVSDMYAQENGVTLILKGHHTIVTGSDGTQYINNTGNPGLSTGGSGDVLAGIIAALAAKGDRIDEAATAAAAVYIHGRSGDLAAAELGEDSITATDVIKYLPDAIKSVHKQAKITCGKIE